MAVHLHTWKVAYGGLAISSRELRGSAGKRPEMLCGTSDSLARSSLQQGGTHLPQGSHYPTNHCSSACLAHAHGPPSHLEMRGSVCFPWIRHQYTQGCSLDSKLSPLAVCIITVPCQALGVAQALFWKQGVKHFQSLFYKNKPVLPWYSVAPHLPFCPLLGALAVVCCSQPLR